ncbi:hypothetical protein BU17DRAFT_65455 [Hysterangium stoloniferum]|nr:hypothetical protein BU17DRAFT_65455 [Hysterangium stoloniferum]
MQNISASPATGSVTLPGAEPFEVQTPPTVTDPNVEGNVGEEGVHPDPKVATLLGMFPDFDISLLQSVLESVGGDQDQAVDVLLGMSDPSYVPPVRADLTQTELDAQYARNLLLEESQSQQHAAWRPRESPAVYRQHRATAQVDQRPAEGDSIAQFQEQIGKIAETGKKTFTSLFSKVKAKIQEFDNPPTQNPYSSTSADPSSSNYPHTPAPSQPYYDPNPRGYDVDTPSHIQSSYAQSPPAAIAGDSRIITEIEPSATVAPTAGGVDPSKIGLLPKRPVTLGSSPQPRNAADDDGILDLEYVENPFEENNRR